MKTGGLKLSVKKKESDEIKWKKYKGCLRKIDCFKNM